MVEGEGKSHEEHPSNGKLPPVEEKDYTRDDNLRNARIQRETEERILHASEAETLEKKLDSDSE